MENSSLLTRKQRLSEISPFLKMLYEDIVGLPWTPTTPLPTGEAATGCGLSPGAPATLIRQKARFKIRDAKCHLRPRSQEPAKEAPRQLLLGEWAIPVPAHVVGSGAPRAPLVPRRPWWCPWG